MTTVIAEEVYRHAGQNRDSSKHFGPSK